MLPNMDGFQILSKLRQGKIDTPILILSAKSELDDKVRGLDGGADDYLTKPFQTNELLARVRVLSRRRGQLSDDKITFSNLELDIKKCEVRCTLTNESVSLGAKEFQLIKYLLSNSNQIISREQIVEKIWGVDNEAEYNNVEVYISFIRKKIAFIGASVKIRAVRGIGYTLEE